MVSLFQRNLDFNSNIRFYFKLEDKIKDGYSSALKNIKIRDKVGGRTVSKALDLVVDGDSKQAYVDYKIVPWIVEPYKRFTLTFNYPIQKSTMENGITITDYLWMGDTKFKSSYTSNDSRKKVILAPLQGGYEAGHYYSLNLNVKSDGGNALVNKNKYYFYILKEAS